MAAVHIVFAGGGTGGHLFPGLAVARAVRQHAPQASVTFFTTNRDLDRQLLSPTDFARLPQRVQPFPARPWSWPTFLLAWRASLRAAREFLREHQPQAVLGLGGYAAGPPVIAARRLGIRTAILNPDALPGRANRRLAQEADLVVLQWDCSRSHFPVGTHCQTLGCPIRPDFAQADGRAGRQHFDLEPDRPLLLVTGASQGARNINQIITRIWPSFLSTHPEWQLLHLTGPADEATSRAAYGTAGVPAQVVPFTHEMHLALAAADAVVSRAGASTLAELAILGKPAILLPYPYHRDRHQHANAQVLVDAGAALLVEDRCDAQKTGGPLLAALELLADTNTRGNMAAAARAGARPNAAQDVAAWLLGQSPE
ncbi:MAG: UDP-N-acetylglucosamine--N-acetylmuramyl-(pentapeptide) pyrophosphoryl-undecaprenol N-acetylglucosamine transferase [Planctomycetes bacterium]|nr:UDP-N-acetylglucosamine--N-acetylmuramyl-(pentapeptide) pyrophosphoryl-undecaprenol N-acetylglucosamine transferase [Planctomycetota bacterium]